MKTQKSTVQFLGEMFSIQQNKMWKASPISHYRLTHPSENMIFFILTWKHVLKEYIDQWNMKMPTTTICHKWNSQQLSEFMNATNFIYIHKLLLSTIYFECELVKGKPTAFFMEFIVHLWKLERVRKYCFIISFLNVDIWFQIALWKFGELFMAFGVPYFFAVISKKIYSGICLIHSPHQNLSRFAQKNNSFS